MEDFDVPSKVAWVNDEEIREMLIHDYISISGTKAWYQKISSSNTRKEFMICLVENNEAIGFTSLKNIDLTNSKAELSMLLGNKLHWGKGHAKEARKLLINFAFNELGLNKIYTYNWIKNEKIIALNQKLGFQIDGVLRNDIFFKGEFRDIAIMSILKNDWLTD
jgi:RimJ/RimL family protein N-acetyltransferase